MKLPSAMRLKESRRVPMWNGPIECRLFRFDLVAGSARAAGRADSALGLTGARSVGAPLRARTRRSAAPISTTGTSEPRLSQVQPCVVTSAPELNEVTVIVAKIVVSIAACAVVFSSGR